MNDVDAVPLLPAPTSIEPPALPVAWELSGRLVALLVLCLLAILAGLFLSGYLPHLKQEQALAALAQQESSRLPGVHIVHPLPSSITTTATLPGILSPMQQTLLYARATGYVADWYKDLGEQVSSGELLAVIEAPDLDAEVAQAQATLVQSKAQVPQALATLELDKVSLERLKTLGPQLAAQQAIDVDQAAYDQAVANLGAVKAQVVANEANLRRLQDLVGFNRIVAPFAGIITARFVERGNLITAGNTTGQGLFQLTQIDPIRVFVEVPQPLTPGVKIGAQASIIVREFGGEHFVGTISHLARALNPASHTMTTEIHIPNHDGRLFTGMFADVLLKIPVTHPLLEVPSTALLLNAQGSVLAVVDDHNTIHLKRVLIDVDSGATIGVSHGISASDRIVVNPGENIADGVQVEVLPEHPADGLTSPPSQSASLPTVPVPPLTTDMSPAPAAGSPPSTPP